MARKNKPNPDSGISRRDLLRRGSYSFGAITALAAAAPARSFLTDDEVPDDVFSDVETLFAGTCPLTPPNVEGPYWLNLALLRRDITEGLQGLPLTVYLRIIDGTTCSPVSGAVADLWHDSPLGKYSGFASEGTLGLTYLRGIQVTGANGIVRFDTVFPGWYPGRTPHMHLKVNPSATTELTTQLYFEDHVHMQVYQNAAPYTTRGLSPTTNATDNFFNQQLLVSHRVRGGRLIVGKQIVIT
jgi:protocatechuate 3,4-dioxygenase beta subunit